METRAFLFVIQVMVER